MSSATATAPTNSATPPRITAIVVTCNEAALLGDCLASLAWCNELIVVDLQSTDGSPTVAARYTQKVLSHPPSPIVEPVRCFGAQFATNDWLLLVDPDERFPAPLVGDVYRATTENPRAGVVRLPWQFYFKGRRLDGTTWGGPQRTKRFLVHRRRARLSPLSHAGSAPLPGFTEAAVAPDGQNAVAHLWMDSYRSLLEKHWRYVCAEGAARFGQGQRFTPRMLLKDPLLAFKKSYRDFAGWRLGLDGLLLSALYGAFQAGAALSLLSYQRRQRHQPPASVPAASEHANPASELGRAA